jgi:hypothetical protein
MTAIPTLANGDTCDATAQFNLLAEALATLGITDTDQLYAIFTELRLKDATTLLDRSGANLQLTDAVTGAKTLTELAGGYALPLTIAHTGGHAPPSPVCGRSLTPIQFLRSIDVLGFRVTAGPYYSGTFQVGLYSNEAVMELLAATPLSGYAPGADVTALLSTPYTLLADRIYWVVTEAVTGYGFCSLLESPAVSRTVTTQNWPSGVGLPNTIDFADTYVIYTGQQGAVAFTLIIDGGMAFA